MSVQEGNLKLNDCGRWELNEIELTCGSVLYIDIDGHWIRGVIEYWTNDYHWFSQKDGVPVVLHTGIRARILNQAQRRFETNPYF